MSALALWKSILPVVIGLVLGNYIYQLLRPSEADYSIATERSFFQVTAVVIVVWVIAHELRQLGVIK